MNAWTRWGEEIVETWDDETLTYTNHQTGESRAFTPEENEQALERARNNVANALRDQIKAAVDEIITIRDEAKNDQATAQALENAARNIAAQLTTQSNQIAGWTPNATYRQADMIAMRDQIKTLTDRQQQVAGALADFYNYRRLNDIAVVKIYNAVLWLARHVTGRVVD